MASNDIKRTEYALEEYYNGKFDNQVDIFYHLDDAYYFAKHSNIKEYVIRAIYYNGNENEIGTEIVYDSKIRKEN